MPGRIEAEDYDLGGQGVGYADTTPGNEQGFDVYRTDDVDIKASREGGYSIGWLAAGEWLAYTIEVPRDGIYRMKVRVGSALPGRTFHIEANGRDVTGQVSVPQTADWDLYETVRIDIVRLAAGRQVLRVVMGPDDFMDLQWIAIGQSAHGAHRPEHCSAPRRRLTTRSKPTRMTTRSPARSRPTARAPLQARRRWIIFLSAGYTTS